MHPDAGSVEQIGCFRGRRQISLRQRPLRSSKEFPEEDRRGLSHGRGKAPEASPGRRCAAEGEELAVSCQCQGPALITHVPRPRSRAPPMTSRSAQRNGIQSISPANPGKPCGCGLVDRSSENHLCRLADVVRSAMVGVHPHQERTAVRVPEPRRDGRNIHAGLDGGRGEGIT